jgi:hypothetical protein
MGHAGSSRRRVASRGRSLLVSAAVVGAGALSIGGCFDTHGPATPVAAITA